MGSDSVHGFLQRIVAILLTVLVCGQAWAGWHDDREFGYRINVPDNWRVEKVDQSPGRMMVTMSPDETVAVAVIAVPTGEPITPSDLVHAFEPGILAKILSAGRALHRVEHVINGLTGQYVTYTGPYDGTEGQVDATLHAFYTTVGDRGYILWWLIPTGHAAQRRGEADQVFATFSVPSVAAPPPPSATVRPSPPPSRTVSPPPKGAPTVSAKQAPAWATATATVPKRMVGTSSSLGLRYAEDGAGFEVNYPAAWSQSQPRPSVIVFRETGVSRGKAATLTIRSLPSAEKGGRLRNVNHVYTQVWSRLYSRADDLDVIAERRSHVMAADGRTVLARDLAVSYVIGDRRFKQWTVIAGRPDNGGFLIWDYAGETPAYERTIDIAKAMIATWVLR